MILYAVNRNGTSPTREVPVVKETKKTYVVDGFPSRVRKSEMQTAYVLYFLEKDKADECYKRIKEREECLISAIHKSYEKQKTADEMFAELGYKCMGNDESGLAYVQNNKRVIYIDNFGYAQLQENGSCYGFRREEVKAVNKKLEEMGWLN